MDGQNFEDIFNTNRSLIIQFLQKNKIGTRSQLSKSLDLTPAAITKIVQDLIEKNVLEETGFFAGEKGRRSVGLKLRQDFFFIGIAISRRSFSIGVFDFNAIIFDYHSEDINGKGLKEVLSDVRHFISKYIESFPNVVSIGISVPGPFLNYESKIALVTETSGWQDINIMNELEGYFNIPIIVMHDANSCALADMWLGDYNISKDCVLVHLLVGEGVGAGIIINGEVFIGHDGVAGEIGHVSIDINGPKCQCGNYGCLESYCSSIALVKRAQALLAKYPTSKLHAYKSLTHSEIFKHASDEDELSLLLVNEAGRYIGCGLVTIINAYNPALIVLSNSMVLDSSIILKKIIEVVDERIPHSFRSNVKIVTTCFDDDPTLYGAVAAAIDHCLKNHSTLLGRLK